jgi:YfiH family protein
MMTFQSTRQISPFFYRLFGRHPHVVHLVSTRHGGISESPYQSLNFGFITEDSPSAVIENRIRLCQSIRVNPRALTIAEQVHESRVATVQGWDRGKGGLDLASRLPRTDAMITNLPQTPLMVLIADCVAVGLYDPVQRAVGIAHAGWRGTAAGITRKTVEEMSTEYGSRPEDMLAGISPSIGPCCYEVGPDVISAFDASYPEAGSHFFSNWHEDRSRLDLWQANRWQLIEAGLRNANIEIAGQCTACHTDMFYSHRAENGRTGRLGALIMLK